MFFQWKLEDLLHFLGFEQFFSSITWRVMELQRLAQYREIIRKIHLEHMATQ